MDIPEEVIRFRESASEYCEWVERPPADAETEAATAVRLLCSLLHFIQDVPNADPEGLPEHELLLKGEDTLRIYKRFSALPLHYYSEIWDPLAVPAEEPVTGDLADDLMDLYLDLKQGLLYFEEGHALQAVFYWTFMFGVHWGRHATSALRVLHCYLVDPSKADRG